MVRPRRPEKWIRRRGGGVLFSQGHAKIDIVNAARRRPRNSARRRPAARTNHARPTEGAYSALLTFDDGAFASCTYSGYAHLIPTSFRGWIGEKWDCARSIALWRRPRGPAGGNRRRRWTPLTIESCSQLRWQELRACFVARMPPRTSQLHPNISAPSSYHLRARRPSPDGQ